MNKFPQNMKEAVIASVPNAMVMVLVMVTMNLWIYGMLTPGHFAVTVSMMFAVAFVYDFFVVGPIVMKLVRRLNIMRAMPFIRVAIMAGTLTFLAPIIESGTIVTGGQYLMAVPRNYVVALLVQIFIALPFGLYVLQRWREMALVK